ncbi:RNA polymerase II-associated [Obelidium mucronatum]|nr:RNA polymerase II-associated [Obelidium mucronatum]
MATKTKKIGQDFLCPIAYTNVLPPLPFEPKLLGADARQRRRELSAADGGLAHFALAVEANARAGATLALLFDPPLPSSAPLDARDRVLLAPYAAPKQAPQKTAAAPAKQNRPIASWLRRTEYIATDAQPLLGKPLSAKQKAANPSSSSSASSAANAKDALLKAIDRSFVLAATADLKKLKHPTNPNLTATELLPLFPAFQQWPHALWSVVFDGDPVDSTVDSVGELGKRDAIVREKSLLKVFEKSSKKNSAANNEDDDDEEDVMSLYVPTSTAVDSILAKKKRREEQMALDEEDEEDDEDDDDEVSPEERAASTLLYKHVRDFSFKEERADKNWMVFNVGDELATFHVLEGRVDLSRKRVKPKTFQNRFDDQDKTQPPPLFETSKRSRTKREVFTKLSAMHKILPMEYPQPAEPVDDEDEDGDVNTFGGAGGESATNGSSTTTPRGVKRVLDDASSDSDDSHDSRDERERKRVASTAAPVVDEDGDAEW